MNKKIKVILAVFFSQTNLYANYSVFHALEGVCLNFQDNYNERSRFIFINNEVIDLLNSVAKC